LGDLVTEVERNFFKKIAYRIKRPRREYKKKKRVVNGGRIMKENDVWSLGGGGGVGKRK